ncbi:hypothetical protein [Brevundimonas sp.]|uniref:hypothetical protein n=1 Tax=Brevundimonas sp. TaxID=1871086 RepID=UPI002899E4B2|nr:hypothetical protein [Brevundimonas sp.]
MTIYSIYLAIDPDGRGYVGCTRHSVRHRWFQHVLPPRQWPGVAKACVSDGIKKFGREGFKVFHIASAMGVENAAAVERDLIEQWGTRRPSGYNGNIGGGGLTRSRNSHPFEVSEAF